MPKTSLELCIFLALGEHDESVKYELPFSKGQTYRVLQGIGGTHSHHGLEFFAIDFEMPVGSQVCAAREGVVITAIDDFGPGGASADFRSRANRIEILHPDGTIGIYLHLLRMAAFARVGTTVKNGELLGLSGNSGWSTCPHLHFHVADPISALSIELQFNCVEGSGIALNEGQYYTKP